MPHVILTIAIFYGIDYRLAEPDISLSDLSVFPSRDAAWINWRFACNHRKWLYEHRQLICSWRYIPNMSSEGLVQLNLWKGEMDERINESDDYVATWDALADAWGPPPWEKDFFSQRMYTLDYRLDKLKRLRKILGKENYWRGRMPCCIPLHRFVELPLKD